MPDSEQGIIFDASAVLAIFFNEPGAALSIQKLPYAVLHAVNLSEVATILHSKGMPEEITEQKLRELFPEIIPMSAELAFITASLYAKTKSYGLSLGDRACLALAIDRKLPVLTADKAWLHLNLGLDIRLIR